MRGAHEHVLLAVALEERTPEILEANERDMEAGRESGLSSALMPYPHRDRPLFDKPYEAPDVIATLARLVTAAA